MCRGIDVQFVHGWCLERLSASRVVEVRLLRSWVWDVQARRSLSRATHSTPSALPVRVTPTLGAMRSARSHSQVQGHPVVGRVARVATVGSLAQDRAKNTQPADGCSTGANTRRLAQTATAQEALGRTARRRRLQLKQLHARATLHCTRRSMTITVRRGNSR